MGSWSITLVAGPSSRLNPASPVPAIVVILPFGSTLRTTRLWWSAIVHVFLSIDGDAPRIFQSSLGGRPSVPRVALFARSRDCVDDAISVDLPDALVLQIADVDVSFVIERNVVGGQLRLSSRTAIA